MLMAAAVLMTSGILYAAYSDSVSVVNHIETGDVDIGIVEYEKKDGKEVPYRNPQNVMPGDVISKIPRITNYAEPVYVRARITFLNSDESLEGLSPEMIGGMGKDWVKAGEYYYYTHILKRGEHADLFDTVMIPGEWDNTHMGQKLTASIRADAIQAAHFKPDFKAMSPWGNQKIELCVHKQEGNVTVLRTDIKNTVEYSGKAQKLVAAPDDFFGNLGRLMPGDTQTDSVEIRNTSDKTMELFFFAGYENQTKEQVELLSALEIQIKYDGKEIYKGKLLQDGLNKGVSLGSYEPDKGGKMVFAITMPSALGNAFARRNAAVKWVFKTQEEELIPTPEETPVPTIVPAGQNPAPGTGTVSTGGKISTGGTAGTVHTVQDTGSAKSAPIKTGDESTIALFVLFILLSAAVVLTILRIKRRVRDEL